MARRRPFASLRGNGIEVSRRRLLQVLLCSLAAPALAQHAHHHHKPKQGGIVRESGAHVYELVARPREITVHVTDEADKPVSTAGAAAKVTLVDSGLRREVRLEPTGGNKFTATGDFPVKPGMSALLEVSFGGAKVAKLRYTLK